jgi:hypothetical protein
VRQSLFFTCGVVLWASCSTGGSRANFELKQIPGTTVFESEEDWASTVIDGRFRLLNNVWNKRATSGRYRQKIFVNDDNGKKIFGWTWKWRDSTGPAAAPEVQVGFSPWNGEAAPDSGFPFLAGSKKLVVDYDISLAASGSYNLAFEFWAVSAVPPSKDTITHEVMIWIASENLASAGVEVGKMTVDGHAFGINMRKNHGDASGEHGNNKWTYLSLIAEKPILHGPLDIGQIIARLIEQGHLTSKLYIANLELADEVQRGSGTTIVSDYAVHVE